MSKARDLADLGSVTTRLEEVGTTDGALSNRNLIINGAMQVWQRGTSQSVGGYGSVDRWQVVNITSSSRQTDVPSGFQYSILLETSAPNFPFIAQKWESVNVQHLSGADITLTFWAKSVSGTASIFAEYLTANSVDNYSAVTARENKAWANPSTSWTKYEYTFTNVNAAVLNGLEIRIGMQNQSSGSIAITGVQLEAGDTATPFEHRSYGQELALCQRYYEKMILDTEAGSISVNGAYLASAAFPFAVRKRATPTMSTNINDGNYTTQWGLAQAGYTVSNKSGSVGVGMGRTVNYFGFVFSGATFSPTPTALRTGWVSPYGAAIVEADAEL